MLLRGSCPVKIKCPECSELVECSPDESVASFVCGECRERAAARRPPASSELVLPAKLMTEKDEDPPEQEALASAKRATWRRHLLRHEAELRRALRDRVFCPIPAGLGRHIGIWGLILIVLGGGMALGSLTGIALAPEGLWQAFSVAVAFLAFPIGGFILYFGLKRSFKDLDAPSLKNRWTPARSLQTFTGFLIRDSYRRAYACLLPDITADDEYPEATAQPGARHPTPAALLSAADLQAYWQPAISVKSGAVYEVEVGQARCLNEDGDVALAGCEIKVELLIREMNAGVSAAVSVMSAVVPGVGLLGTVGEEISREVQYKNIELCKLMRCIDGQWLLYDGTVGGVEDHPHCVREAVRIAQLTDRALDEELKQLDRPRSPGG
jgi:hypothetical protein